MNPTIATGHMMRCLSIAKAARKEGIEVTFLVADKYPVELLEKHQFAYIVLHTRWDDLEAETDTLCEWIQRLSIKTLLIDSYQVTFEYLKKISQLTKTYYLDDLNQFIYPVHGIICYAIYYEKFHYEETYQKAVAEGIIDQMPELYLGCDYVPLREEFQNLPPKVIKEIPENILILSGGSDPYNAIGQILDNIPIEEYKVIDVICGRYNENYHKLVTKWSAKANVLIHQTVDNIVDYMMKADIAISAGGSTLYELCAVGTPTIMYSFADNQLDNVFQLKDGNVMSYVGDVRSSEKVLDFGILNIYKDKDFRRKNIELMKNIIDGRGANRISKL